MSLEAAPHDIQMRVLRALLLSKSMGFADLQKSTRLTSDHFTFHIKSLLKTGYITRLNTGAYGLTVAGKEYANRMDTERLALERQPKTSVVLMVVNAMGEYLQQERLKHPYYGYWGRPTGKVRWGETLLEAGARELLEETGLQATLTVKGVYHKLDYDETTQQLREDKYLYIIFGTHPRGTMITETVEHRNAWLSEEDFMKKEKRFGSAEGTAEIIATNGMFYREERFFYPTADY